jgi:hypothetical protein
MARESFPKRQYNSRGGPVDIANHKWVHQNLQLYGDATTLVAKAFSTDDPFAALGYAEDIQTRSIAKWYARPCQVDTSYLISFESHGGAALAFAQFLADQLKLEVECDYMAPVGMKSGKFYANWSRPIYQYDAMGNRTRVDKNAKSKTKTPKH